MTKEDTVDIRKLLIIDEIDNLSKSESAKRFINVMNTILSGTNTTIIGIANRVKPIESLKQESKKEQQLVKE